MKAKLKPRPKPPEPTVVLPPGAPVLLDVRQVAACLGFAARTVKKKRAAGDFPDPDCYVFNESRWKPETVRAWIDAQPKEDTSQRRAPGGGE